MPHPEKHAGKKSLKGALVHMLPLPNALCKEFKNNQTINKTHVYPVHILNTPQGAVEDSYMESTASESLEDTVICENDKQWEESNREALQKQTQKERKAHSQKKFAAKQPKQDHFASLPAKELQKHLETFDTAMSTHTLEGMTFPPKMFEISKEYAKGGNFSHEEFNTLMSHPILQGDILC